jgi:hypothetical protein
LSLFDVLFFFSLGTNESHELAEIKRLLNKVNNRLDSVEIHLQETLNGLRLKVNSAE